MKGPQYEANGNTFIYNWHNRENLKNSLSLSPEEVKTKLAHNEEYVIRFKSPKNETLKLQDLIRGEITIDTNTLDDKVLFKSDGMPTYHLANIVDDHLMNITHVIRGEEWLPSLALHQLLYDAFEWEAPAFAHLPLIMKPVGKGKLSKRDGDAGGFPVFPLEWKTEKETYMGYREEGYLPEAVVNMLALLGWNPGTEQEIFSLEELAQDFDLARVQKGGSKFDPEKAKWFQHHYFQQLEDAQIIHGFEKLLKQKGIAKTSHLPTIVSLLKERASFVSDLWEQGNFFFEAPSRYDEKAAKKAFKEDTSEILLQVISLMNETADFSAENLSAKIKGWITEQEMSFGKVMMPLRLALVGEMKGPDVFDIFGVLGKEESINRVVSAIKMMAKC